MFACPENPYKVFTDFPEPISLSLTFILSQGGKLKFYLPCGQALGPVSKEKYDAYVKANWPTKDKDKDKDNKSNKLGKDYPSYWNF